MQQLLLYLTTVLIWGTSWFAITFQLGEVQEAVSLFYRYAIAAIVLICVCIVRSTGMRFSARNHLYLALQGLFLFSLNYLLFYWCTGYIASGLVAVVFSTMVVMNIFNSALFLKNPVRPLVVLGALFGLVGISMVFGHELIAARQDLSSDRVLKGLALGLVATYCASIGNILSARNQASGIPVLQSNAWGMLYGSVFLFLYSLVTGAEFSYESTPAYTLSLLYLAIFASVIAFGAYLTLVGRIGADKAAYATVLFPLVALALSTQYEGFKWTFMSIMGVVLVLIGNVIVVGRKSIREFIRN